MASNINATLEALDNAIDALASCCASQGETGVQTTNPQGSDGEISVGIDGEFLDFEAYFDAKCSAGNAIYDTIKETVGWLNANNVDLLAGAFGSIITGLTMGLLFAGPVGWGVALAEITLVALAGILVSQLVDFADLETSLDDKHDELVLSLYNSATGPEAKTAFMDVFATATPTPGNEETLLMSTMLNNNLLNELFAPSEDTQAYTSPDPVDCGAALLAFWTFPSSGEGWTFVDESVGNYTVTGQWESSLGAWEMELEGADTGAGERAKGTIYITGLTIGVSPGDVVQADYSSTSDGITCSTWVKAIYADLSEYQAVSNTPNAHVRTLNLTVAGTITELRISTSRETATFFTFQRATEEVRVMSGS